MPIPSPREKEDMQQYMSRCMPFLHRENPKMPEQQKKAVCINTWNRANKKMQRKVFLHSHVTTKRLGNALLIEGVLLRPGVYTGLDGVPTKYSEEFIHRMKTDIVGRPIKFAHEISPDSMLPSIEKGSGIGYWTGSKKNGVLQVRGYIFDPRAIAYAQKHPNIGLSMEADVATHESGGLEEATEGMLTGGVLIDDPACSTCRVEHAREVNLQGANTGARGEKKSETMSATQTAEEFIGFSKDANLAKPSREDFFKWIEDQLKKAGIAENIIPKAIAVLKRAVKVPYPYPFPKAQEVLEAEFGKELAADLMTYLSAYTECVGKEIKGGKTMKEAAEICKGEEKQQGKPPEKTEVEKNVETLMGELAERRAAETRQLDEDITKLTTDIKLMEKDFDGTKFIEGITCKHLQKKMLQKYLDVLKKNTKPIRMQVADKTVAVKDIVNEMFGENATIESVLDLPKESGK